MQKMHNNNIITDNRKEPKEGNIGEGVLRDT